MHTRRTAWIAGAGLALAALSPATASAQLTLQLTDYLTMPMTGTVDGAGNVGSLARINSLREEPGGAGRLWVNDLNGPLYIIDKATKKITTYLDFNGRDARPGLFHRMPYEAGYANGLISFQFDPDYLQNGRFYTVHLEEPSVAASAAPNGASAPGLNLSGYTTTPAITTPGDIQREAVLIEWTDSNIKDAVFEGTAREILRVQLNTRIHPMGDLIFNPTARRGDAEWRVLYISCGDGGSGEQTTAMRMNPQRLDDMVGKILRIIPDLGEHADSSVVSDNGRYRIPNDNPFVSTKGARREIWAYGFRNPHRLTWDVNPANPADNHLIAMSIGLHTWESVYVVHKGGNYGYSMREGSEALKADDTTTAAPDRADDVIPVRVSDTITAGTTTPLYPVVEYSHTKDGGDAISSGFVYRGKAIPALQGKFICGDITTGRIWYVDYKEMLAADDGKRETMAAIHNLRIQWSDPKGAPNQVYPTMFPIAEAAYHARGGKDPDLPGSSTVSGTGRADIRLAVDAAGELYVLSKTDGVIRRVTGAK